MFIAFQEEERSIGFFFVLFVLSVVQDDLLVQTDSGGSLSAL